MEAEEQRGDSEGEHAESCDVVLDLGAPHLDGVGSESDAEAELLSRRSQRRELDARQRQHEVHPSLPLRGTDGSLFQPDPGAVVLAVAETHLRSKPVANEWRSLLLAEVSSGCRHEQGVLNAGLAHAVYSRHRDAVMGDQPGSDEGGGIDELHLWRTSMCQRYVECGKNRGN